MIDTNETDRWAEIDKVRNREPWDELQPWDELPETPQYEIDDGPKIYFAIKDMENHVTDETWLLQTGLEDAGYIQYGKGYCPNCNRNVADVVDQRMPSVVIVSDKREWDAQRQGCFDKDCGFTNVEEIRNDPTVFRGTIYKDLWYDRKYQRAGHEALNPHFYITYYSSDLINYLNPWIRPEQIVRTYHCIKRENVPAYSNRNRQPRALVSGALMRDFYRFRMALCAWAETGQIQYTDVLRHPGYGNRGQDTPRYLNVLSQYRVHICTSSIFGCAFKKIIESVAAGCTPITDLPVDEVLPEIDEAVIRVKHMASHPVVNQVVQNAIDNYDPDRAEHFAKKAIEYYNHQSLYAKLASDIDQKRGAF